MFSTTQLVFVLTTVMLGAGPLSPPRPISSTANPPQVAVGLPATRSVR